MEDPLQPIDKYKHGFTMALASNAETLESLPPLASARLPLLQSVSIVNGGHLNPVTKYHGVPKRYEDTKPVITQNFTHRKIVGIGDEIHRMTIEMKNEERIAAIKESEKQVWAHAEVIKQEAIRKCEEHMTQERDRALQRQQRENMKAIKEEALRVEGMMQQLALEQIKQEREEGEKRLQEAVTIREKELKKEKQEALNRSIREERDIAAKEAAKMAKYHKEVLEKALKNAELEKIKELEYLSNQKEAERQQAGIAVRTYEKQISKDNLAQVRAVYEQQVEVLKESIAHMSDDIDRMSVQLNKAETDSLRAETEYHTIREAFMDYINKANNFTSPEADYLLPSATIPSITKETESCLT